MSQASEGAFGAESDADVQAVVDATRRFARERLNPHVHDWDEAGGFPREVYRQAAEAGLLALGYPQELGGTPASWRLRNAVAQTLARETGSGGLHASLFSLGIGLPPIVRHGSPALQRRVVPGVLRGERIAALAITEPGGGSDVAQIRTTARRDGGEWVIDGEKVFITSGMRADWISMAVRTGEMEDGRWRAIPGARGISMIVVPGDASGLSRTELKKMGWWASDTAHLRLDRVRVPADCLVGSEGGGFKIVMSNFNGERLGIAALALGFAQACLDEALDWTRQRKTFGEPLVARQVVRHKLMDMRMRIDSTEAWVDALGRELDQAERQGRETPELVARICLLKNHATQTMQFCADQAVQMLGGMGFMRGTKSERIYRECKVLMIGGGAEEIMKDLAARQLGL